MRHEIHVVQNMHHIHIQKVSCSDYDNEFTFINCFTSNFSRARLNFKLGPGWLIQAYHQLRREFAPGFVNYQKGALD